MKRWFVLLAVLLLMSNFVLAQDSEEGVKEKSNELLEKEVNIPENLRSITRVVFGLEKDEVIDFQRVVILIGVFIMLLILAKSVLELTPFLNEGVISWAGAVVVLLLAGELY